MKAAYPLARLKTLYEPDCSPKQAKVETPFFLSTSNCIYKFTCTCQSTYIGRAERRVQVRVSDHAPKNLRLRGATSLNNAIARNLTDTGHIIEIPQPFEIISRQENAASLRFAEAVVIRKLEPDLSVQKETIINLSRLW